MEDFIIPNAELWETFQTLKADNYQLRKKISKKEKEIIGMKKFIRTIQKENFKLKKEANR